MGSNKARRHAAQCQRLCWNHPRRGRGRGALHRAGCSLDKLLRPRVRLHGGEAPCLTWNRVFTTSRGWVATHEVNPAATPAIPFDERCTLVFGFPPSSPAAAAMSGTLTGKRLFQRDLTSKFRGTRRPPRIFKNAEKKGWRGGERKEKGKIAKEHPGSVIGRNSITLRAASSISRSPRRRSRRGAFGLPLVYLIGADQSV